MIIGADSIGSGRVGSRVREVAVVIIVSHLRWQGLTRPRCHLCLTEARNLLSELVDLLALFCNLLCKPIDNFVPPAATMRARWRSVFGRLALRLGIGSCRLIDAAFSGLVGVLSYIGGGGDNSSGYWN